MRGKWSANWHKFVNNSLSPNITTKNFLKDDAGNSDFYKSSSQRGGENYICLNSFLNARHKTTQKKILLLRTLVRDLVHKALGTISIKFIIKRIKKILEQENVEKISLKKEFINRVCKI